MGTDLIVCLIITVFVGLFQFGVSRFLRPSPNQSAREQAQANVLRMWGYRALLFMVVFTPMYWLRLDDVSFVVLVYMGLVLYNSYLLKSQIRKVQATYPVEVKKEMKMSHDDIIILQQENPLIIDEFNQSDKISK